MRSAIVFVVLMAASAPSLVHAQTSPSTVELPTRTNDPIVGLGIALWASTYIPSMLIGVFGGLQYSRCSGIDLLFDVPFASIGGASSILACTPDANGSAVAFGFVFGFGQIVGVILTVAGATAFRLAPDVPVPRWSAGGLTFDF